MGALSPLLILLPCLIHLAIADSLLLDPPFPPTAFLNQKYEVKFQVRGLVKPTFSFKGLPNFLIGQSNGTLSGTPQEVGSFKIMVGYSDKSHNGSEEVIISIASNDTTSTSIDPNTNALGGSLYIQTSTVSWIYRAEDDIYVELAFLNAADPVVVSYKNLPAELTADNTTIQGAISTAGLYTFAVTAGDSQGMRVQSYYTINIQPKSKNVTNSSSLPGLTEAVDVPNRNAAYQIDTTALSFVQTAADNAVKVAFAKVIDTRNNVTMIKNQLYNTASQLVLAQQSELSIYQSYLNSKQNFNSIQSYINDGGSAIAAYKIHISVGNGVVSQSNQTVKLAQEQYKTSLDALQNYSLGVNASATTLANLNKEESDAAVALSIQSANSLAARNAFNQTALSLQTAKASLTSTQSQLANADQIVAAAQLYVQLATADNDAASSNLVTANSNIQIAQNNLQSISTFLQEGQTNIQGAKTALGIAQFNLVQAENNLFVAQAAKAAADKSLAIIIAQGNVLLAPGNSTYIFKGCNNYAYPSMFGTARIEEILSNGFRTSGGHTLVWGECTKKSIANMGDLVYYEGSLREDAISLWLIENLSH